MSHRKKCICVQCFAEIGRKGKARRKAQIIASIINTPNRHWVINNVRVGSTVAFHSTCCHITSVEVSVGYMPDGDKPFADCEHQHFCHYCDQIESEKTFELFDISADDFTGVHVSS